jgi:tetratricopeptide (TPR) repeat protein
MSVARKGVLKLARNTNETKNTCEIVAFLSGRVLLVFLAVQIAVVLSPNYAKRSFWPVAQAAENRTENKYAKAKTKKRYAVGKSCGNKLESVQAELAAERWSQAKNQLLSSLNKSCVSSYEKSQVWNFLAYTHYALGNIQEAIKSYKKVIAESETDERLKASVHYSAAQLYFANEDYANAARYLETWMRKSEIAGADGRVLLAQAYYQLNRMTEALDLVDGVIVEWQSVGKVPKESWWDLQRVIYYANKDYARVIVVLKNLIKNYPKYNYWRQLGAMYMELEQPVDLLVSNEVIYLAKGLENENVLLGLAYLFVDADAPFLGARIVEKGLKSNIIKRTAKNMEFLGHALQRAQEGEKARPVLEEAAGLSDQGKIWARLASVYLDIGNDAKAVRASRNALNKGGLKRDDLTYMVLGSAQLNLHCFRDARRAFEQAATDKRSAKFASKWITYSAREGERRDKLRQMGADIADCVKV